MSPVLFIFATVLCVRARFLRRPPGTRVLRQPHVRHRQRVPCRSAGLALGDGARVSDFQRPEKGTMGSRELGTNDQRTYTRTRRLKKRANASHVHGLRPELGPDMFPFF